MEWIRGPFINSCTGGLLADTDAGSQVPYFLTANQCLSTDYSSLETFFNYTTDPCTGGTVCNEATDSCDTPVCDGDGFCEAGEDCNNCPNDCWQKINGNPNSRYCCDGRLI